MVERFMAMLRWLVTGFLFVICVTASAQAQIQLDRPKAEPPLDNPYTMAIAREKILETAREVLRTCDIVIDEVLSKPSEGRLITRPVVFTKGVTTKTDLEYLATLPADDVRNWRQGRFVLEISALPLDQKRSQLFISARIQGRLADALDSNKWIDGQSNGRLEDEVMRGLAGKILGIDLSVKTGNNTRRILNCEY